MSLYVQFFVAEDDETAAAVLPAGPGRAFTTVSGAYFDPDDAMMIWAHLADARTGRWDTDGDRPTRVACGGNDGSAVYVVPAALMATLTRLEPDRLRVIAEAWQAEVADGEGLGVDTAREVVVGVAALARAAARSGHRVYCWASQFLP